MLLCLGGGLPHPRVGGYPIPGWGVPHPRVGVPQSGLDGGGYPRYPPPSRPGWHTPHQDLARVPPPSRPGWGTPPPSRPGWVPPPQTWDGVPPTQNWDGVPPYLDLRWGTPRKCGQTEYITSHHPLDVGSNKKVPLRERKRHTTCGVASARYDDLSPDGGGGTLSSPNGGYPIQSWTGGYPI